MNQFNGEDSKTVARWLLAGLIVLLSGSGCQTVDRGDSVGVYQHRNGSRATIEVTHWLTDPRTISLPTGQEAMTDVLLRTRPLEQQQQLAGAVLARVAQSDNRQRNELIRRMVKIDLVQLSRGSVDWLFPLATLSHPVVATIPLRNADRLASVPVDMTSFRANLATTASETALNRRLPLYLSGLGLQSSGSVEWRFAETGPAYVAISQLVRNLPSGVPWLNPPQRLLGEAGDDTTDVKAISNHPLATVVIVSRLDPLSGRLQRLVLPTFRNPAETRESAIAMLERHGTSRVLLPGDGIEITSWERMAGQLKTD